jgi:PAS domain S-box-containing protein
MMAGSTEGESRLDQPASKEELHNLMVEGVRDYAIILLDPNGQVVSWNVGAERILGYTDAEIIGQHFSRFFTPEDRAAARPKHELHEAAATGVAQDENWMLRKDGSRFYGSGTTTALRDGELRGFAKIFRDLTERKRLEEELRRRADELAEADRRKDEFLAMLGHELRNPLAPVMNALEIMRQDRSENPVLQKARSMVERQVRHMTRLIDDLLDVTRITRGKVQLRREHVDLSIVVQRAVDTARPLVDTRRLTLSVSLPRAPVWVDADPARLEQVVGNLLNNAAKYTDPGGRIWVTAAETDGQAEIRVRDTGVGLSPELLPRVFDLFTQAERTLDRSQGGLGIGLTLVKSLVEMHGGAVSAQSGGPGRGSEFVVTLPTTLPPTTPLSGAGRAPPASASSMRVLIVDDNMDAADSLTMLLKLQGYETHTVNDGLSAVGAAVEFRPDVIFLDIGLPGADGYEVARQVRRKPGLERVVLIAMTGYGQESHRRRSEASGFSYHLVKPAEPAKVQELLTLLREGGAAAEKGADYPLSSSAHAAGP